uniref:non-specific serine/threonine protein kinase n=1 Tax=Denticeps clupeoides TaxID=299321 RepID=A0AAY4A5Y1_9TELE
LDLSKIGKGRFGMIYKALHFLTAKMMAVKVVKYKAFAIKEVGFMMQVEHKNLTRLLKAYVWRGKLYIFMDLCGGGSLSKIMKKTGAFTEVEIKFVAREMLLGLAALHQKDIMHRDIKSANVLVNDAGQVKITDFNGAKRGKASNNELVGTLMWMAPEVTSFKTMFKLLDESQWSEEFEYRPTAEQLLQHSFLSNLESGPSPLRARLKLMKPYNMLRLQIWKFG